MNTKITQKKHGKSEMNWHLIKKKNKYTTKLIITLGDTITDQQSIAEEFNNYFVNIGKSMADSIVSDKPSNKINYKVNTTSNSFFLSHTIFKKCST